MWVDLHRFYGITETDETLDGRTWQWLTARATALLDEPGSITRRKVLSRGI